jgi:hypothetical protein
MSNFIVRYDHSKTGERGDKGDKGDIGSIGPVGPFGPIGLSGPKGIEGCKGNIGFKGDKGYEGNVGKGGITYRGDRGSLGDKGEIGNYVVKESTINGNRMIFYKRGNVVEFKPGSLKGSIGDIGISGNHGNQGCKGNSGAPGPVGEKGTTADNGSDGNVIENITSEKNNNTYQISQVSTKNGLESFNINIKGNKGNKGDVGYNGVTTNAFYSNIIYGFIINNNSCVVYNASQGNDEEYYLQPFQEYLDIYEINSNDTKTKYYYFPNQDTRYISSQTLLVDCYDKEYKGLFNQSNNTGIKLAGSFDSISPENSAIYRSKFIAENRKSRGFSIPAKGKLLKLPYINGITVKLSTVLDEATRSFEYIDNSYVLSNKNKSKKLFYGQTKINDEIIHIPIKIFIRFETHFFISGKETTSYQYIDSNGNIETDTIPISNDCSSSTISAYTNWFSVENSNYIRFASFLHWNIINPRNDLPIKLSLRYKFALPSDIKVGNIINNFDIIDKSSSLYDLANYSKVENIDKLSQDKNTVESLTQYNNYNSLESVNKNIYLPQLLNAIIPVREFSCVINASEEDVFGGNSGHLT